jgi:hypothetical protein
MATASNEVLNQGGRLADRAAAVLRRNDLGGWTKPAPNLYPHQWSWDSAFIAIGLARLDTRRAARELTTLFSAQWTTGLVPQIVFNPRAPAGGYFPDAARWDCAARTPAAPHEPRTSGICQPPVHAIAAQALWLDVSQRDDALAAEARAFLREIYPKLVRWHRYLATARDPDRSGLVTIYHPWESGTDNSPRWDAPLAAVEVGDMPPYTRRDLQHVADPGQRPTDAEYDRYLWLLEALKRARYDDAVAARSHPFRVKDVLFSAILAAANDALLEIATLVEAPDAEQRQIAEWRDRGRRGLAARRDTTSGLCLDYDLRANVAISTQTIAGLAPLVAGGLAIDEVAALAQNLESPRFAGHPAFRWALPPSTSPDDPAFNPRSYWRGPVWPFLTWLFWWALRRAGEAARAERLRDAALAQIDAVGFAEYIDPVSGEPLGSDDQSWTAAVALDWLASGDEQVVTC